MVFASLVFLYFFLPLSLLVYFALPGLSQKNLWLTLASLVFYAWGEPIWVSLLLVSSAVDYVVARQIEDHRDQTRAKVALGFSILSNIGVLFAFKYSGLLMETVNAIFGTTLPVPQISLPIGISFYTFQTLSYTLDVYRGQIKAERSFSNFLCFVSLFHQLVAGPIVRFSDVSQALRERVHSFAEAASGVSRFVVGLFKKTFFANTAAILVAQLLDGDLNAISVGEAWLGLLMFTLQIYFDFSGYSDMAIGMGQICAFRYPENFNYPYTARSARDFWRRWHISLSSFFRDYVYIPMGGNRRHVYLNLAVVWALTGLWHGASWNFVLWGLFWGGFIALERAFLGRLLEKLPRFFGHLYLCALALVGWAIFYFTDFGRLKQFLSIAFGLYGSPLWREAATDSALHYLFFIPFAILACLPLYPRLRALFMRFAEGAPWRSTLCRALWLVALLAMLLISTALLVGKSYNPFLYFRF